MPTIKHGWEDPSIQKAIREGQIPAEQVRGTPGEKYLPKGTPAACVEDKTTKPAKKKKVQVNYVTPVFLPTGVWVVPLKVTNPLNGSRFDRSKIGRAGHERTKVAEFLGTPCSLRLLADFREYMDDEGRIEVELVKLGPGEMDSDGVQGAMKYVRDGVSLFMGLDDKDKRWQWEYGQERHEKTGIRITIKKL